MSLLRIALIVAIVTALPGAASSVSAQTTAILEGRVFDTSGGAISGAVVRVRSGAADFDASVRTDADGHYDIAAIPPAVYTVSVEAPGFSVDIVESLQIDAGRTVVYDFRLALAGRRETVLVRAETPVVERATAATNHAVTAATIRQVPLNGRHFTDLGLLGPESVAPSQAGYSSRPIRGVGVLALNIGGNREEAVAFVVNGITTNNLTFGSLIFEPPLASIEEVRVERSTYGAEYGHVSGAVVNIVTRSGSD